ncbi:MAG TPA: hypothetical protein VM843_09665 [Flavisolibacter sp.]|jgi:hypothetical protein|nr:hypothetical protein [Flavisolibacter sp.]
MDYPAKDEDQKEVEKRSQESGQASTQNTSQTTASEGKSAPADRDAGSLDHGEMGGNFKEDKEEGKSS